MNESTIDILLVIINVATVFIMLGMLVAWLCWHRGYKSGYHKVAKKQTQLMSQNITKLKNDIGQPFLSAFTKVTDNMMEGIYCTECGAPMIEMLDHFHGCPIAAEFKLVTIAKPGD